MIKASTIFMSAVKRHYVSRDTGKPPDHVTYLVKENWYFTPVSLLITMRPISISPLVYVK